MRYKIRSFLLDKRNRAVGVLDVVGKDGSFEVPGGGAGYKAFFHENLNERERYYANKQFKNFEKLMRQVDNKVNVLGLGNEQKNKLRTKIQDKQ